MRIQIDRSRCQGHGRCWDMIPALFDSDDRGHGVVIGDGTVPAGQETLARDAVSSCPEQAISLVG